jgi:hypothetical protein
LWSGNRKCIHANNILHGSKLFFGENTSFHEWPEDKSHKQWRKKSWSSIKGEWHKAIRLAVAYVAFNQQYSPTGGRGEASSI